MKSTPDKRLIGAFKIVLIYLDNQDNQRIKQKIENPRSSQRQIAATALLSASSPLASSKLVWSTSLKNTAEERTSEQNSLVGCELCTGRASNRSFLDLAPFLSFSSFYVHFYVFIFISFMYMRVFFACMCICLFITCMTDGCNRKKTQIPYDQSQRWQ